MSEHLVVYVTAPEGPVASELARTLVQERLVACVNLVPGLRSLYRWEGAVHDDAEVLLICKTTSAGYGALERRLLELHPYDVPEIVALPIVRGSAAYLDWVTAETSTTPERD